MQEGYLTLKENLCGARVFLNLFGLTLEDLEDINEFTTPKIFNSKNDEVGEVKFGNGLISINAKTSYGNLQAKYEIAKYCGFEDFEMGRALFVRWNHLIEYKIDGPMPFTGNTQIGVKIDSQLGHGCRIHTTLHYINQENHQVTLKIMDDGKPLSYKAVGHEYDETLEIDPWNDFSSFMYHVIRSGQYIKDSHYHENEDIRFVSHNGQDDKKHIKTIVNVIKDKKHVCYDNNLYLREYKEEDSEESTIQKGQLMQNIDPNFSTTIKKIIELFSQDDVNLITNLLDTSFKSANEEEKLALFGFEIPKITFQDGTSSLLEAYFGNKENKHILPGEIFQKIKK